MRHQTRSTDPKTEPRSARRGMSMVYITIMMVTLCGLVSLGVDYGRVQLVKAQLRAAADAAARAGMAGLPIDVAAAQADAADVARQNLVDGQPLELDVDRDIEFGIWDPGRRTFTPLSGIDRQGANSIRINARRTASRGNAVPLVFARILGVNHCDVTATAVAARFARGYGVVGLEFIKMGGNTSDSYWGPDGYSEPGEHGSIASNGTITLSGSTYISGNAHPGPGHTVIGASGRVSGSTDPLASPLNFPNGNAGIYATNNDNHRVPGSAIKTGSTNFDLGSKKSVTLPGGNYYFNNFNMGASSSLKLTGPTTIYIYGTMNLSGNVETAGNMPKNLRIISVSGPDGTPPGEIRIWSSSALYADIYAPEAHVTLGGTGDIFGAVLGKSVTMSGNSAIHYDTSLMSVGGVSLVQ